MARKSSWRSPRCHPAEHVPVLVFRDRLLVGLCDTVNSQEWRTALRHFLSQTVSLDEPAQGMASGKCSSSCVRFGTAFSLRPSPPGSRAVFSLSWVPRWLCDAEGGVGERAVKSGEGESRCGRGRQTSGQLQRGRGAVPRKLRGTGSPSRLSPVRIREGSPGAGRVPSRAWTPCGCLCPARL